jgi:hypothetical protein
MCSESRSREMSAILLESLELSLQLSGCWLSEEDIEEVFDNEDVFPKNKTIPGILEELEELEFAVS